MGQTNVRNDNNSPVAKLLKQADFIKRVSRLATENSPLAEKRLVKMSYLSKEFLMLVFQLVDQVICSFRFSFYFRVDFFHGSFFCFPFF